jgi:hypothetical protein
MYALRPNQKPAQQKMRKQFAERVSMYERVNRSKLEKDEVYRRIKNLEPLSSDSDKSKVQSVFEIPKEVISSVNKEDIKSLRLSKTSPLALSSPPPSQISNEPIRPKTRTPGVSGLNTVPTKRQPPAAFFRNQKSQKFIMGGGKKNTAKNQMRMTFVDKGFERDSY